MFLGANIRYLRKVNGWSQEYLAERLGYKNYTSIQKWESNVAEPRFKTVQELARIFNVDIDDLTRVNLEAKDSGLSDYYVSVKKNTETGEQQVSDEVTSILQTLHDRPEMKMLFDSAKTATPEQIKQIATLLNSFKKD